MANGLFEKSSITLLIFLKTQKKTFNSSSVRDFLTSSLNSLIVFTDRIFNLNPSSVRKILTDLRSTGSAFLYINPFSSIVFSILVRLLDSSPINGAILVAGVPSVELILIKAKPIEDVKLSAWAAFWLYILEMECQVDLIWKSTVSSLFMIGCNIYNQYKKNK